MTASPASLTHHLSRTLRLAVPVMLARAGLIIMVSVDSIMTGRAGASELAYYAISLAPHVTLLVTAIGLLIGTMILTAQAHGAGRPEDAGTIWATSLWIAAVLGAIWMLILLSGEDLLLLLGQEPSLAAGGGRTLIMFAFGMPAILMYVATTFFLEGLSRPNAGMVIALAANLLNAALNWVLIYGHLGMPEMGAAGAALATAVTRWVMLIVLIGYVLRMADGAAYGLRSGPRWSGATARTMLRIGLPLSLATGLETACFATVTIFAGRLGEVPLAGFQIAFNVVTFVFMLAIGLSAATSVRVANAVGRRDRAGMAMAGWVGLGLVSLLMVAIGVAVHVFDDGIAGLYSTEAAVLAIAVPALSVVALVVVMDGAQAVAIGALRGTGDVQVPTMIYAFSFWVVGVPAAYLLGLAGPGGVNGLFWGLFVGLTCTLVLLCWRFAVVARRGPRPL